MRPPTILLLAVISYNAITNALRPGYINTFAGTGVASYGGDGSAATSAWLNGPRGVAVDSSNNVYIVDSLNNKIRFVSRATGIITTYAGIGTTGYDGDNGPATLAQLNNPSGMAIDVSNNVYIADYGNNKVRFVAASSRNISTYAGTGVAAFAGDGTPATAAAISKPVNVAVDTSGNLFVVDFGNARVRLVTKRTGIITTFYSASAPWDVVADSVGNAFISTDGGFYGFNRNVLLVSRITGSSTTYAGGGYGNSRDEPIPATSYWFPGNGAGLCISLDASENLYISDQWTDYYNPIHKILLVTKSTGSIATVAGTGPPGFSGDNGLAILSKLNAPMDTAVDSSGNLFIADYGNNRIRMVQTTSTPTPAPLHHPHKLSHPGSLHGTYSPHVRTVDSTLATDPVPYPSTDTTAEESKVVAQIRDPCLSKKKCIEIFYFIYLPPPPPSIFPLTP